MPRVAVRRKAPTPSSSPTNNNAGESDDNTVAPPKKKLARVVFQLPLPKRAGIVGRALVCGQGDMGQLGLGDDEAKFERKRPALVEQISNVVDVCAGGMHNLVLTLEGSVYSFGCNDEGALGRDSSDDGSEFEPVEIELPGKVLMISAGDSHSACLLEDGRVFAWGSFRDSHGSMGLTLEGNKRLPIDVLPGLTCSEIASGADHLVILTTAGKVYTVGCGEQGQLGRVSLRSASGEGRRGKTELLRPGAVIIKRGKPIEKIWATLYCTFLRESQTGYIWAFGLNNYKQLAYLKKNLETIINPINTKFENVRQIAGGQHHTLVLKEDGACFVIGRRDYGRLGLGTLKDDVTELQPIKALAGKKIVSVSCGESTSFGVTAEGQLYSWGMGSNHQLGTGSEDDALEPVLIVSKQTQDKRIICASSGGQHSIFLVEDDEQPAASVVVAAVAEKKSAAPALTKKAAAAAAAKEKEEARKAKEMKENEDKDKPTVSGGEAAAADADAASTANVDDKASTNGESSEQKDAVESTTNSSDEEPKSEAPAKETKAPVKRGRKKK